jgi:hypothetical protein
MHGHCVFQAHNTYETSVSTIYDLYFYKRLQNMNHGIKKQNFFKKWDLVQKPAVFTAVSNGVSEQQS